MSKIGCGINPAKRKGGKKKVAEEVSKTDITDLRNRFS